MKHKIELGRAREFAESITAKMRCYCKQCEIAGSIRREKPEVGDIEIVMEPFDGWRQTRIFTSTKVMDDDGFWRRDAECRNGMRFFQRKVLIDGAWVMVDMFNVLPPAQWGVIYTIRTGPAEFNVGTLIPRIKKLGYRLDKGMLQKLGDAVDLFGQHLWVMIPTPTEERFLEVLGLDCIEPKDRK